MPVSDRRLTGVDTPDYRIYGVGTAPETAYAGPWPGKILAVNFNMVKASSNVNITLVRSILNNINFKEASTAENKTLTKSVLKNFSIIGQDVQ